jgi:hypothetical protein
MPTEVTMHDPNGKRSRPSAVTLTPSTPVSQPTAEMIGRNSGAGPSVYFVYRWMFL